jgi:D-sedoheptulose 7-phosphate isomerase
MAVAEPIIERSREDLRRRNAIFESFFYSESESLARACLEMSRRFQQGGRLLAFGRGPAATDAQHVAVEFIHPIIVGKRALPTLDLGPEFASRLPLLIQPNDIAMGFAFGPDPDPELRQALQTARDKGALTFALAGDSADYAYACPDDDPFICQEMFEVLYHLLWETVHVYLEHREQGHDVGASAFLYPFLGKREQALETVVSEVQGSMIRKADEVSRIRLQIAETECDALSEAASAILARIRRGGKILTLGNGGSATDANDLAIDCISPPPGLPPLPAVSLASDPAVITAIANDIGAEAVFVRQIIAHGQPDDIAIGFSTSGGSANILAAFAEARKRGMLTVAILGYDGGRIAKEDLADHILIARSDYVPRIQEAQASLYHVLRRRLGEMANA